VSATFGRGGRSRWWRKELTKAITHAGPLIALGKLGLDYLFGRLHDPITIRVLTLLRNPEPMSPDCAQGCLLGDAVV
jgi:hypothetical protein